MGKSSGTPPNQQVTTTQTNLPEYARPYFENVVNRAQALSYQPYQTYDAPRVAGLTPAQQQVQQNTLGLTAPNQVGVGSAMATQAGLGALQRQQYNPMQFTADRVYASQAGSPQMSAAQTDFGDRIGQLERLRMDNPEQFGQPQADRYMTPYIRNVLDIQKREAVNDAKRSQIVEDLGAARQGTYGGSRQLIAGLRREQNLGQQLGDIEARGLQSAYENAQQQFERDRAAGLVTGQANLQAGLQQQQLGTTAGLQAALANLNADQQGRVQNLAAELQTQGLNAEQALRAALANQQTGLESQRLGEQSRQFGAQQGLAGLQLAGQMGQTLGNLGQYQQQMDLQRLQAQAAAAGEQRTYQQQLLDQSYADFLRQRDYPMEQLGYFSNILRGLPMQLSSTQTAYATPPSMGSQLLGGGLSALSMARLLGGGG